MTIQVDFWQLVSLLLGFIGTLATFGKILLKQLDSRLEHQADRVGKLETQLNEFITKLPLEYRNRPTTPPTQSSHAKGTHVHFLERWAHGQTGSEA